MANLGALIVLFNCATIRHNFSVIIFNRAWYHSRDIGRGTDEMVTPLSLKCDSVPKQNAIDFSSIMQ